MAKPEVSRWIAEQRKRQGWKSGELALRMTAAGYEVAETTIRTWEAGRRPSAENIAGLERLFGSPAPQERPETTDSLVSAVRLLVEEIRAERDARLAFQEGLLSALQELARAASQRDGPEPELPVGAGR